MCKSVAMSGTHCHLKNLNTNKQINLNHMVPFTLGRNKETDIQDTFVSRQQIICFSDTITKKLKLKVIGNALSGCNGLALKKDIIYTIGHGDIIEVKLGNHKFEVVFTPNDEEETLERLAKKPKLDFPIFNAIKDKASLPDTKKQSNKAMWEEIDNKELLIYTPSDCEGRSKIASFDIDGTIIKTKSGARFPKNCDDWTWYFNDIREELKKIYEKDFKIVFFTNQSGVGKDVSKIKDFKKKIETIVSASNLPIQVFISLGKQMYRKPRTGMWNKLVNEKNDNIEVDLDKSFYVGDAAGREKNWAPKRNKDHSASDRLFAINIGLKFYTPEEYFFKQRPAPFKMPEFDPREDQKHLKYPDLTYEKLNVVLMVGGPGSGKSSFVKEMLLPLGYVHVSRDKLGSWQKCVAVMEEALAQNKNVVIDNTNVDKATRERFVKSAKNYKADVRCFLMETSLAQMRHNNKFRELTDKSHQIVSDIIIFSYRKNFQEPEMSEGFVQILKIPCIIRFADKSLEKMYKCFILES